MTRHLTAEQKLVRARTQLLLNHPFFGTLCVRLKLVPGSVPTMATNGRHIVYNPAYVDELKPAELEGVLAHEVLHCALAHHCRRGQRDPELWNEAADYAINPILLASGVTLPAGVLVDAAFADLSAEEIYEQLRRQREQDNSAEGAGGSGGASQQPTLPPQDKPVSSPASGQRPGAIGEVTDAVDEDGVAPSQAEKARQEREWAIASEQALRAAKACGCEPSGVERAIERKRESEVDWRAVLRDFVAASRASDYSWTPPNRRHLGRGLYIPSIVRASAGELVIAVDTSGSIGADEIEQFAGEISAIAEDVQPDSIRVVYCDAAVQADQEFEPGDAVVLSQKGRGGTDFRPVFTWVDEQGLAPACLIYLTDLRCKSYPELPPYPVLWVTDSRKTGPFGETLRITPER